MIIHYDISDDANWRTACKRGRPKADGSNLTLAENHVTCDDCLAVLGYDVDAEDKARAA